MANFIYMQLICVGMRLCLLPYFCIFYEMSGRLSAVIAVWFSPLVTRERAPAQTN